MSRETDSSSSGPGGRGGAAYPSGTPPYGTRRYPSPHPQEEPSGGTGGTDAPEPAADERKTETTLTTRIRINIPGSRPIPPVVVRTPVPEGTEKPTDDGTGSAKGAPGSPLRPPTGASRGAADTSAGAGAPGGPSDGTADTPSGGTEKPVTSDWFAPRKQATLGKGIAGAVASGGPESAASGSGASGGPGSGGPAGGSGSPGVSGGTLGGGLAAGGPAVPGGPAGSAPRRPDIPYLSADPTGTRSAASADPPFSAPDTGRGAGADGFRDSLSGPPPGSVPFPGPAVPGGAAGPTAGAPAGPTTGPVTGGMHTPAPGSGEHRAGFRPPGGIGDIGDIGGIGGSATGADPFGDDAAHVSGDTLVSGIPAVPSADRRAPAGPAVAADPGGPAVPGGLGGPGGPSGPDESGAKSQTAPARSQSTGSDSRAAKGRSKLVLAGAALFAAVAVAYGAGLLMDHADVPNGTVVLGTDIGGKTRDEAVKALQTAVGDRATAPLKVRVGGRDTQLRPELAGLAIDPQETVRQVAHRDYNPVSVIGSLFGGARRQKPVVTVDQEKLRGQLRGLTAGAAGGSDGMVKFVAGKPVGVPGTPFQAVDADSAVQKIIAAYELRAQTGQDQPVDLPVTTHQPKVTQAAIDRAIKELGEPAMSGRITVVAGSKSVPFSPQKSLSRILTLVPAGDTGQLTFHIDLGALKELYGNAFDGVLLDRGTGSKTPVTPADVASAMLPELRKTAPAKTAVLENVAK